MNVNKEQISMSELEQVNGGLGFGLIPDDDHTKENIARSDLTHPLFYRKAPTFSSQGFFLV